VKVVVGLGNPGERYAGTRHNVGWLVLDRLAERAGLSGRGRQRDASNVAVGRYEGLELTLVKPLTFMNDSGLAVRKVLAREHAPLGDLLVIADDFALPFGKLRFRESGSHGGHNGLRSVIDELGTEKFSRFRIGIGDPVRNARDHVLSRFEPRAPRKLLLKKKQIDQLLGEVSKKGATLVPLQIHFNERGRAKVLLGVGVGRQKQDKRQHIADRDWARDKARLMRARG